MKSNGHGFIGDNLTRAREARGLTQAELARLIDKTRNAVSQFELGKNPPSAETLTRIGQVLNLPLHYFLRNTSKTNDNSAIFFRAMSATTKTARVAAERRFEWLKEFVDYLRSYVDFPVVKFPDFDLPKNPRQIDSEMIEDIATETRRFWGLGDGVISNVTLLLENNGAIISRFFLDAKSLDAFSEFSREDETPYIVLGADKNVCARSRFDAAHELGHLILHRHLDRTRLNNSSEFALVEKQANRFAGAFLFPAKSYFEEVFMPSLDTFRLLKTKWQVSIQLMIFRGHDLGLISDEQATRLWKNCARRGWKFSEPYDDTTLVEQPRLLSRSIQMLLNENVLSPFDLLSELPFATSDILEFSGLPDGFFDERVDSVISLKDYLQSKETSDEIMPENIVENVAQIIEFRRFGT